MEKNGKNIPGIVLVLISIVGVQVKLVGQASAGVTVYGTSAGGKVLREADDVVKTFCPVTTNVLVNVGMVLQDILVRGENTPNHKRNEGKNGQPTAQVLSKVGRPQNIKTKYRHLTNLAPFPFYPLVLFPRPRSLSAQLPDPVLYHRVR